MYNIWLFAYKREKDNFLQFVSNFNSELIFYPFVIFGKKSTIYHILKIDACKLYQ